MEYRVELDIYNGPLDLLLYLIKRDELDIQDIPIARITDSYMQYVNLMREIKSAGFDINRAGDFLVMAATLMEIKSAMLLPRQPTPAADGQPTTAQELTDPRYELVRKLLEYKHFKETAATLEQRRQLQQDRFARIPARPTDAADEPPPLDLEEVQVWDLLSAFSRLMREVGARRPQDHEVIYDDTPLDLHAADIEDRLRRDGRLTLRQLIVGRKSRSEMIGIFLALLELIRQKKLFVQQSEPLGELVIDPVSSTGTPADAPPPAPLHLADTADPQEPSNDP